MELFSPDKSHDCPFDAQICHACNNNVGPTFCVGPHLSLSMHRTEIFSPVSYVENNKTLMQILNWNRQNIDGIMHLNLGICVHLNSGFWNLVHPSSMISCCHSWKPCNRCCYVCWEINLLRFYNFYRFQKKRFYNFYKIAGSCNFRDHHSLFSMYESQE